MSRREQYREETIEAIKVTARQQMDEHGTAGLTLRGIARAMDMTAPALYHYFASLDDLITALIIDAYTALATTMESAGRAAKEAGATGMFRASLLAYRNWAVHNPMEFQLVYGNPIPGYKAPAEITTPLARRPFEWLGSLLVRAELQQELNAAEEELMVPDSVKQHLRGYIQQAGYEISILAMYRLVSGWTHIHGMVVLEILGHSGPVVGNPADFYQNEIARLMEAMGFKITTGIGIPDKMENGGI